MTGVGDRAGWNAGPPAAGGQAREKSAMAKCKYLLVLGLLAGLAGDGRAGKIQLIKMTPQPPTPTPEELQRPPTPRPNGAVPVGPTAPGPVMHQVGPCVTG